MKKTISNIFRYRTPVDKGRLNKVLFVKLFAIGDCLNATPTLRALRKGLPNAHIDVLVGRWSAAVFRNNPYLNKLIEVDDNWFRRPNVLALFKLMRKIRHEKYDAVLLFHRAPKLITFFRLCGAGSLIGLDLENDGYCLTHPVEEKEVKHEIEIYNTIITALGINLDGTEMDIFPTENEYKQAETLWNATGFNSNGNVIGITPGGAYNPGETMPQRIWSHYSELVTLLINDGFKIVYFGGSSDIKALQELPKGNGVESFIGKCNLAVSAELMKRCSLIITHDSGPMHLASASGVQILSIFGPTDPGRKAPLGANNRYLSADLECAPCYHRGNWRKDCTLDCIGTITAEQVMTVILEMLPNSQ
ncbi:MAG: glycosyltransferase family 9 protein [Candidatus Hatepunaea meridiana]|nr:glycosyltransferase family 9 protein [Candidatus Hatepunaea meridiana]